MQCGAGGMENILDRGDATKRNCVGSRAGGARKKQWRDQCAHVERHMIHLNHKYARFFIARFRSGLLLGSRMRVIRMVRVLVMVATNGGMFRCTCMLVVRATAERRVGGRQGNYQQSCEQLHSGIVAVKP